MLVIVLASIAIAQSWSPLVTVGRADHDTSDLALGPSGYSKYSADPVFVAGRSDARRDWPYVIPGPGDAWAGSRNHAFEIRFGLAAAEPNSHIRLRAQFVETHPTNPPRLALSVNGMRLTDWDAPRGKGDAAVLGRPEEGKLAEWIASIPTRCLRSGTNTLRIESISGSWAVFDAVAVEGQDVHSEPLKPGIEVIPSRPSPLLRNTPSGPAREIAVRIVNLGPAVQADVAAGRAHQDAALPTGATDLVLLLPAANVGQVQIFVNTADGRKAQASTEVVKARPWRVFLFPEGHVDIGYTHPQDVVAQIQVQNLRDALGLIESTRNRAYGERYRWNSETSWTVEKYLAGASASDRRRLSAAIENGELGVSAAYANMLYGLCRPEEMLRTFTVPDVPRSSWETATLSDVPGMPWGLVTALRQADVRNLVYWPNGGDVMRAQMEDKPFWWLGPDGVERVFVWPMTPYSLGTDLKGVLHMGDTWFPNKPHAIKTDEPSRHFLEGWLPQTLDRLGASYPYDILGVPWSMGDNSAIDLDVPEAVAQWNARYASPKIEIVTIDDACRRFLAEYGSKIPTRTGDFGPQWEDGAASSSRETAMNRQAAERLVQAEIAWSLLDRARFPRARVDDAWRNVLLYSEHTWGSADSIEHPDSENQRRQWATKSGFAYQADDASRRLLAEAVGWPNAKAFDVLNTSGRMRSGLVELDTADGVVDDRGRPAETQRLHDGRTAFIARDVPALSARRYRLSGGTAHSIPATRASEIANDFYRVKVDGRTGEIASLYSLRAKRELAKSGFGLYGDLIGADPSKFTGLTDVRIERIDDGPLVKTLRVSGHGNGAKGDIVTTIRLVKSVDAVELTIQLDKEPVRQKEIAFCSFPFSFDKPTVHVEGPWAPFDAAKDLVKGANDQFFTVNRWVQLQSPSGGATVVSLDTPIMVHGRRSAARLGDTQVYDPHSPSIHFQLAQNHWSVNYRADQSGPIVARYVIRADSRYDPASSSRLAEDYARPLLVASAHRHTPVAAPFKISSDVEISAIRPTKDGKGWILRVYGWSGKAAVFKVTGRVDLFESDGRERKGAALQGHIMVPPFGVRTMIVERAARR